MCTPACAARKLSGSPLATSSGAGGHGAILVRAKTIGGETWTPKTGEDRIVPISRQLRGYLDKYRAAAGSPWFFPSPEGGRWDPDNFSQLLRESNAKNGLTWSCLDFRHTFGSQLAMKGESLYKISTLMGNSPDICRKHYAALMPESLMGSVDLSFSISPNRIPVSTKHTTRSAISA